MKSPNSPELKPFITAERVGLEYTFRAFVLASFLTVLFGAASGYLGLKIGTTFAASIPASIMALAILRGLFRNSTILESNIVQTQASSGEAVMAGVIFIVPALIFLNLDPSLLQISVMAFTGGLLGIFIMIPLRHYFVKDQHGVLPFPEGVACANILKLGEEAGGRARRVLAGMGLGGLYNLLTADGLRLFSGQVYFSIERLWGLSLGIHLTPLMLGVGFLVGPAVGITMLGGALLKGVLLIPGLNWSSPYLYGQAMTTEQLDFSVRMIGAGAVATGGFLGIYKLSSQMVISFKSSWGGLQKVKTGTARRRIDRDIALPIVVTGLIAVGVLSVVSLFLAGSRLGQMPDLSLILISLVLILVLGFLFVTLCARLVGFVGTSSYPLSGLTIGALLVVVSVLRLSGVSGAFGMGIAIVIGVIICVAISATADISQDLKTGALLGATPQRQQWAETAGLLITSVVAALVVMLFHQSGELATLPAPQARMMAAIVEGVMNDQFQWIFAGTGVLIALLAESFRVSSIMLAVGLYLPVPLASAYFLVGGALRALFDRSYQASEEKEFLEREGTLLASGMIAGWALMGILLVSVIALNTFQIIDWRLDWRSLPEPGLTIPYLLDLLLNFVLYCGVVYYFGKILRLWSRR